MRALFGIVSLLVVLAIVGMVVVRQGKSVAAATAIPSSVTGVAASDAAADAVLVGTPRQQAQGVERRVQDDVAKAMDQAAAARKQAEDQ